MKEEKDYYEDEIDLKDLFLVLYRKRWLIIIITVLSLVFSSGFWFFRNKEEKQKVTWGIKAISLELSHISHFPQVFEKDFFSSNIEPVLKKFVKIKAYYKKTRVQEKQGEGSLNFERQEVKFFELTGTKEAIDSALSHLVSRLIGITKKTFRDEITYQASQIYQLNSQIEQMKINIDTLKKERQYLIKLKKSYPKTSVLPSVINLSPQLIPYLDVDTQLRGIQVRLNNMQLNLEDLLGLIRYHKAIVDYLKSVLPSMKKVPYGRNKEEIYSSEAICNLFKDKLQKFESKDPYLARAFYKINTEVSYLCGGLKTLKVPIYTKKAEFSKLVIIITTSLGFLIAIFLAFLVEFLQNMSREIKERK